MAGNTRDGREKFRKWVATAGKGGAVAGYGVLWAVYHAYRILRGKEGMGAGDFKLLAAIGHQKLGQPVPESNLVCESNSAVPQQTQR